MQDIVHDAHSFATQITAKGACRYTNTTRNPPHRASRNGKAEPRAMDSSRNRKDVSPRSKSFGLLGRRRGHFLQQIASYERLNAGEKAHRSFYICKTPGHEHSLRGFQRAPYPLDAYNSRFAAKTGGCSPTESRDTCTVGAAERGDQGRPLQERPLAGSPRGVSEGPTGACRIRSVGGACPPHGERRHPSKKKLQLGEVSSMPAKGNPRRRARWGGRGRGR